MSILIKDMEIPDNCTRCDYIGLNFAVGCPVMSGTNGRAVDCPLVSCDDVVMVHKSDIRLLPTTNADRIRAMSDEELAEFANVEGLTPWCRNHDQCPQMDNDPCDCRPCMLEWLKQECGK